MKVDKLRPVFMTTALSTAPTKIFKFHSSIFPCYKELHRRPFFLFFIFLFSETKSSFNGPSVLPAEASVFMSSLNTK